ncbi:methyltransferase family protein [Paenibacillus xanthanilyticus]|uniref:Methyltransferase family protein n=1 Tax=Paenibacillus xanthanilyticus TaxID=1783531 RepID=A0ABV8K7X9_9BACL
MAFRISRLSAFLQPDTLIVEGLYQYSRNPMYLGLLVALTGVFILPGAVTPVLFVLGFLILTNQWYIKVEERAMTDKFGIRACSTRQGLEDGFR